MFMNDLRIAAAGLALSLSACTSVSIDEHRVQDDVHIADGDTIVVLGRRHSSNYETEPSLVSCIANEIGRYDIDVVPETQFVDSLYPWFEPRTAPMRVKDMERLLQKEQVANRIEDYQVRYIVWIDGNTETISKAGSIGCSIGAGGAGCFGFGTWEKESDYEASVWDYQDLKALGKISADAEGTSYMPAVIVPIPLIARVQKGACKAMASQLGTFFNPSQAPDDPTND